MVKEIVLAIYDDQSGNPNVMGQVQARQYALDYLAQRIVSATKQAFYENHVSSEVMLVESVELRPDSRRPSRGQVVARCQHVELQHRKLKRWEKQV